VNVTVAGRRDRVELEREAGVALLLRVGRNVQLTAAGQRLADHAEQALAADEEVRAQLTAAFDGLASVSSDVDPQTLDAMLSAAGFVALGHWEHPLPNGKTLIRQDYRPNTHTRISES
jgi:signal transduction histidine kinase